MRMKKRNEEEGYLIKASREREIKRREHHNREKRRVGEFENEKIPRTRKRAIEEQRLSESEDWGGDSESLDSSFSWMEPEKDPSSPE